MKFSDKIQQTFNDAQIKVRPNASPGIWLMLLLPVCVISTVFKHPLESSVLYKSCSIFSFGLLSTTILFILQCTNRRNNNISTLHIIPALITGLLLRICLHKGLLFCFTSSLIPTFLYIYLYKFFLRVLPLSFTLGEAAIVTQAFILFLYSTAINVYNMCITTAKTKLEISTLIIQVGLTGIGLICCLALRFKTLRKTKPFYIMAFGIFVGLVLLPLDFILKRSVLLWILWFIFEDFSTLITLFYWGFCCVLAIMAIAKQIFGAQKASTVTRKVFHVLAVVVFVPGLINQCTFLYLASGVVLGIFIALELLRILNVPPLGKLLQDGFTVFSDEKDTGLVALTPIYLLVGCSLPLWLHPTPCDLTNSAGFNLLPLLSGILSIGVGDTAASLIGTWVGKHRWSGTKKTIEGTLACILSQLLLIYILIYFDYTKTNYELNIKVTIAVVVGSLIEAKTSQVDNLVIPLVMFTILN